MKRFLLIPLASALLFASPSSDEQIILKGDNASALLVKKLGGELKIQMQTNGAIGALHFCSQNALSLTEQVAKETKTSIRRVSINERNPVNKVTANETALLKTWEDLLKNGQPLPPYEIVNLSQNTAIYYKPIMINNEACLKCHGNVEGELAKAIKAAYPEDKATGYKMGDLRGMVAVTIERTR
jgi:hypothetical protein